MDTIRSRFLGILLLFVSIPALAQTTLFEVTDGESRILVGGTIHLLHPDEFPLPDAFDRAYEQADRVYFEMDLGEALNPAFGMQMMEVMKNPEGRSLQSKLSPAVWERLEAYAKETQFPLAMYQPFDPALLSMVLVVFESQRRGIQGGVDEHFYQRARADDLPLGNLETTEEVLGYMEAMTGLDGDWLIESTLRDLNNFDDMMTALVRAWRRGDMDTIYKEMGKPMREESPELYELLLIKRNQQWLPQLEAMFSQPGTELVLVGAMHLAGPHSVLKMLEDEGYKVTRYNASH
ncbi:TraB/GumN family protein [Marinimicrobium sp. ABcell2]|uniref:TraB/GumN family protein n=1 Tax=Marinimicrobium sp. ABcell2 TaxID=3069751 RepID=UPI0027B2BD80|nr:TraB/GumN family protein [Marinimicrobium sp. ABcell2]MDQ2076836.1 TraB/GumN family protein [Marinimicrobium sp. ABcell2]